MQFSVVIPTHNEEENIGILLTEICQCLKGRYEYEVLCIDDHSTDNTGDVIRQQAEANPEIRYIRLNRQSGQSGALRQGIMAARYPTIVSLDGDGQNDPADIPLFVRTVMEKNLHSKNFLLIGHRTNRRDTLWKRITSRIANAVRSTVLGDDTPDSGCGIKAFDRTMFLNLPAFNHMHRFMPALVRHQNGLVLSIPVNHRPRKNGSSHYGTIDRLCAGIVDILGVIWLKHRALQNSSPEKEESYE